MCCILPEIEALKRWILIKFGFTWNCKICGSFNDKTASLPLRGLRSGFYCRCSLFLGKPFEIQWKPTKFTVLQVRVSNNFWKYYWKSFLCLSKFNCLAFSRDHRLLFVENKLPKCFKNASEMKYGFWMKVAEFSHFNMNEIFAFLCHSFFVKWDILLLQFFLFFTTCPSSYFRLLSFQSAWMSKQKLLVKWGYFQFCMIWSIVSKNKLWQVIKGFARLKRTWQSSKYFYWLSLV